LDYAGSDGQPSAGEELMLESRIRDLLCTARDEAKKQGINAEFSFHREHSSLIRLGNSAIGLSTYEDLTRLDISVFDGRKTGDYGLTADIVSLDQLRSALKKAHDNAQAALPKDYEPIFGAVEKTIDDPGGYDPALENLSPEAKGDLCAKVVKTLKPRGDYDFSGSWSSGSTEMYLTTTANSNEAYRKLTDGRLVLVLKEQNKKWELSVEQSGRAARDFSSDAAIREFEAMLPVYEKNPGFRAQLGHQRVMFGPQSISQLMALAIWSGFGGRAWEEKRAFTSENKPGDKLLSDLVTISDDPTDANVYRMPFDFKGIARKAFPIVEQGVFKALMYDSATAAKYGRKPTGHDIGSTDFVFAPGSSGPGIAAGRKLAQDALYIPHLHYIHMPDPARGMFTGSSRFNARQVKGGEFVAPMCSTRVTDTIPNVLSHVIAVSSKSVLFDVSATYGRRTPEAVSVPEYIICDNVRINDVADGF
jgi:predicted Zn-dependent protease